MHTSADHQEIPVRASQRHHIVSSLDLRGQQTIPATFQQDGQVFLHAAIAVAPDAEHRGMAVQVLHRLSVVGKHELAKGIGTEHFRCIRPHADRSGLAVEHRVEET